MIFMRSYEPMCEHTDYVRVGRHVRCRPGHSAERRSQGRTRQALRTAGRHAHTTHHHGQEPSSQGRRSLRRGSTHMRSARARFASRNESKAENPKKPRLRSRQLRIARSVADRCGVLPQSSTPPRHQRRSSQQSAASAPLSSATAGGPVLASRPPIGSRRCAGALEIRCASGILRRGRIGA